MKAAVMRAYRSPLTLEEVVLDEPGPGEVLVRTVASGICHSDVHVLEGHLPVPPHCVLGHEPAGVVEAGSSISPANSVPPTASTPPAETPSPRSRT